MGTRPRDTRGPVRKFLRSLAACCVGRYNSKPGIDRAPLSAQPLEPGDRLMSEPFHPSEDALRSSVVKRVDKVCDRFEAAWRTAPSTGQRPRIEDYLADAPASERAALLRELLRMELEYCKRN